MLTLLKPEFYQREDVVEVARDLIGKVLVTEINGIRTAGRIIETEAYRAPDDRACHAYGNRRTSRTETMFMAGGHAYIYLCYGIHHLFNVVTGPSEKAHAVLIRAVEPVENEKIMLERRGMTTVRPQLTAGPGVLSKALGIDISFDGCNLLRKEGPIWIEEQDANSSPPEIASGTRVGIESAGESALLPWRFWEKGSRWRSKAK